MRRPPKIEYTRLAGAMAIGLCWLAVAALAAEGGWLTRLESAAVDLRFRVGSQVERADSRVAIINISQADVENAARELQLSWPWPRAVYGELLDHLAAAKPRAVFFDLLYTEQSAYAAADDRRFAEAIRRAGNVYLAGMFHSREALGTRDRAAVERFAVPVQRDGSLALPQARGLTLPHETLAAALADTNRGLVDVTFHPDQDKIGRHYPLLVEHAGRYFPSPGLRIVRDLRGAEEPIVTEAGHVRVGPLRIPTEHVRVRGTEGERSLMALRFHGGARTYPTYGFAETMNLHGDSMREAFEGRVLLIGSDAGGLLDLRENPFATEMAGVEFHAAAIDNLWNGDWVQPAPRAASFLLLALACLVPALFVTFSRQRIATSVSVLFALGHAGLAVFAFREWDMRIEMVAPLLGTALSFTTASVWRSVSLGRRQREARYALEHFLPPTIVDDVLGDLNQLRLGGERQEISVFFSDLVGFTQLSEQRDPHAVVDLVNDYLTAMCQILHEEGATIDKYVGDAIVAFWNAPLPAPDHALRACRAALRNQAALAEFHLEAATRDLPELNARIGIHTGAAVVGFMGFRSARGGRFNYTMIGDSVNLGARLEAANKVLGTGILISESTQQQADSGIETRELGRFRVEGRSEPTAIYELLALRGSLSPSQTTLRERFQEGLSFYRKREFREASERFEACLEIAPSDGPSAWYLERSVGYLERPPHDGWNAVHDLRKNG